MIYGITGFIAGSLHVLSGPDHLSAVAPLSFDKGKSSWKTGFLWGLGHTIGIFIIGVLALLGHEFIPVELISSWSERFVGVILIGIGMWGIKKLITNKVNAHEHKHDQEDNEIQHLHIHVHPKSGDHSANHSHNHSHTALSIGFIHGVAGSSHLFGILPALALPSTVTSAVYLSGYAVGTILSMVLFITLIGLTMEKLSGRIAFLYNKMLLGFSLLAVCVGIFWIIA